jgi:hypothetical protein
MGKASSRKAARRSGRTPTALFDGGPVYRFFDAPEYADALAAGRVWISTLDTCRRYEDPRQGDSGEAHESYISGAITAHGDNPTLQLMAARSGIYIPPTAKHISLGGNARTSRIPDAYVLCLTEKYDPNEFTDTFGKHCVEVFDVRAFFQAVTEELVRNHRVFRGETGKVLYAERRYAGLQSPPGRIGFVKPADPYAAQREFRMLWHVEDWQTIKPFLLDVPAVTAYCRRIT